MRTGGRFGAGLVVFGLALTACGDEAADSAAMGVSATATATSAPMTILEAGTPIAFARLPVIGTAAWEERTGPAGMLAMRVPPGWDAGTSISPPEFGEPRVEYGRLAGPSGATIEVVAGSPAVGEYRTQRPELRREVLRVMADGQAVEVLAVQFAADGAEPGALVLYRSGPVGPHAVIVTVVAKVSLPAPANDVATLLAAAAAVTAR